MQTDVQPFWISPYDDTSEGSSITSIEDLDQGKEKLDNIKAYYVKITKNIINQANVTHQLACKMETNFKNAVFRLDSKTIPKTLKDYDYDWLPTEESLVNYLSSYSELQENKIEEILPKVYTQLQTVSAGLELIFENEKHNQFNRLKSYLRSVLCEMYTAIRDCHLLIPSNILRSVVPDDVRNMTEIAESKIRNWIIFRNFIDILKCITDVLRKFLTNITDN